MTDPLLAIDYEAFSQDLSALRAEIEPQIGEADFRHLQKMERWGRLCTLAGYATAWIAPNPISAYLLSQGNVARWAIVLHHVSHRGLDRVPGVPHRYTSRGFAAGARRYVDWLDWILPEAWHIEHNVLHHYRTGEVEDPDLMTESARTLREGALPLWAKYGVIAFYACTWKLTYYAPSTFQALLAARRRRAGARADDAHGADGADDADDARKEERYVAAFNPLRPEGREFWRRCVLPYAAVKFGLVPALFLPLGAPAFANVLANTALAELLANVHSFLIITPNHAGADLYQFTGRATDRAEFYVRQAASSTNYPGGDDVSDFLQGFLNYQIEHHLFPDLPPLKYREIQPRVKAICEKHGVPYVEESLFRRTLQLLDVLTGKTSMRTVTTRSRTERGHPHRRAREEEPQS
jgi:fatty acid desaturase